MMITTTTPRTKSVTKLLAGFGGLIVLAGLVMFANRGSSTPSRPMRVAVTDSAQATTLATNFAPIIYLFAEDRNRPSSVEHFFTKTKLMNSDGTLKEATPTSAIVGSARSDCYLEMDNPPTKNNPIDTGETTSGGMSTAPLYARVFDDGSYYRITYGLFYPISGYQTFRISYHSGRTRKRNFEWAEMAFHEGDWEHVQVWVTKSAPNILVGIAPGQHGDERYYPAQLVRRENGHPVLYSAWNTHAMYPAKGQYVQADIPNWIVNLMGINWLKIIDTTQTDQSTKEYALPSDFDGNPKKLDGSANVVVTNGNEATMAWLNFDGRWGPEVSNSMKDVPNFGPNTRLNAAAGAVNTFGKGLFPDLFNAKGPKGPQTQGWWADKIPGDAPSGQTS